MRRFAQQVTMEFMPYFRMADAPTGSKLDIVIYATHPAAPGTFLVHVNEDGSIVREPAILWGSCVLPSWCP